MSFRGYPDPGGSPGDVELAGRDESKEDGRGDVELAGLVELKEGGDGTRESWEEPEKKEEDSDEEEQPKTFFQKLKKKVIDAVNDAGGEALGGVELDDLKNKGVATPLLLVYGVFWLFGLVWFTYTITNSTVNQKFLSMDFLNDESTICAEVPLPSIGVFEADQFGNWQTQPQFNFNSSIFALQMLGSNLGNADFTKLMKMYSDRVKALGAKAVLRGVAWNWMAWSTMNFVDTATNTRFYTIGTAANVYDLSIGAAAVASYKGVCTNTKKGKWTNSKYGAEISGDFQKGYFVLKYPIAQDPSNGKIAVNADQTKFGPCSDQGYIQDVWGWDPLASPDFMFSAKFDAQTVATIIGLNAGLINKKDLKRTRALYDVNFLGLPPGEFYIDPYNTPMNAIYCLHDRITNNKNKNDDDGNNDYLTYKHGSGDDTTRTVRYPDVCFYPYGKKPLLLYPATAQLGQTDPTNGPQPCQCTLDKTSSHYADFNLTECNKPKVLVSLFYNIDANNNVTGGVFKMAMAMQKAVQSCYDCDSKVGALLFPAMSSAVSQFASEVRDLTSNQYCPGGSKDVGYGDCNGVCTYDYTTPCTTTKDCQRVKYTVQGDDAEAVPLDYMSDDGATCTFVCSTDQLQTCSEIKVKSKECPGLPGLGCIQEKYTKANADYWNTSHYFHVSYNVTKEKNKVAKKRYPVDGYYDSTRGGCKCVGYPGGAAKAAAADAATDDAAPEPEPEIEPEPESEPVQESYATQADSTDGSRRRRMGSTPNVAPTPYPAGEGLVESRRSLKVTSVTGWPVTAPGTGYIVKPKKDYNPTLYASWCCPGVTKCQCLFANGTSLFSTTKYSAACCPDSTKCWCSDGTKQAACCLQKYDEICCSVKGQKYDNATSNVDKKFATSFKSVCPDNKCAAIVFLVDATVGIFNPLNRYNAVMKQLSEKKYYETTYKFVKATSQYMVSGRKLAERVMCVDTFYNSTMMNKLAAVPPIKLIQSYYECHQTPLAALQSAVGSAAGSASLYASTAMAIVCGVLFFYLNKTALTEDERLIGQKEKERKDERIRKRANKAVQLLMGTIAEEYIQLKSKMSDADDPGLRRMTERLETYRTYFPNALATKAGEYGTKDGKSAAESEDDEEEAQNKAMVGKRVGLVGLSVPSFNNAIGKCIKYDPDESLFNVTLVAPAAVRGKKVKVRFENMYIPTREDVALAKSVEPPVPAGGMGIPIPLTGVEVPVPCTQA